MPKSLASRRDLPSECFPAFREQFFLRLAARFRVISDCLEKRHLWLLNYSPVFLKFLIQTVFFFAVLLTVNLKKTTCTKELINSNLKGLTYHDKYPVFQTQPLLIYKLILLHLAFAVCSNPKHPSLDILLFVMGFTCPFAIYLFCTVALAAWSLIFADGNSYFDTVGQQFHFISQ